MELHQRECGEPLPSMRTNCLDASIFASLHVVIIFWPEQLVPLTVPLLFASGSIAQRQISSSSLMTYQACWESVIVQDQILRHLVRVERPAQMQSLL